MQISGVSLALTWPRRLYYSEFCARATATSFPLSKHTGGGETAPAFSGLRVCLQLTWEVVFPLLLWSFPPSWPLLQAFPLLVAGHVPLLLPSLAGLFIYSSVRGCPSPPSALSVPHPLCYLSLLFLLLITQFLFFLRVGAGLSRGLC
jgi:hypothetical protein